AGRHPEVMLPAHHQSAYRFQADRHSARWQAPLRVALKIGLATRSKFAVRAAIKKREQGSTDD
ncbi:MAG: dTDP-Rha--alpha-D-GlcNAc-pyrophosphate polyprenol alpha-3-L-rhamnosyltransferase, partial [Mycobacteriaceae bacterium]